MAGSADRGGSVRHCPAGANLAARDNTRDKPPTRRRANGVTDTHGDGRSSRDRHAHGGTESHEGAGLDPAADRDTGRGPRRNQASRLLHLGRPDAAR